jgi:hypothetical protein
MTFKRAGRYAPHLHRAGSRRRGHERGSWGEVGPALTPLSMSVLLVALGAAMISSTAVSARADDSQIGSGCYDKERGAVKVLADSAARRVKFPPKRATVEELRTLRRPARVGSQTPRIAPIEFSTYRVNAFVVAARRVTRTGDIELAIRGQKQRDTLIVAFPDESCPLFGESDRADQMHESEHSFTTPCGTTLTTSWTRLRGNATVVGVGFFTLRRSSSYAAPNGFELHPALSFDTKNCQRP